MQENKYLKHLFYLSTNKHVKNTYINKSYFAIKSNASKTKNESAFKENDDMFTLKEEKNLEPIVYLYNTHQGEKYLSKDNSYIPSIIHPTKYLGEKLKNSGLPTIIEGRSVENIVNQNGWSYGSSYKVSRYFIEDIVKSNPSIKYLFDIHRDAGSHDYTTICINDKCYAKLLFIIGLENTNYIENQKYAENLNGRLNNKLSGISKGILQKKGKKVTGVYNQDFSNRTILIEVGGENNTIDEVYNTIDILSEVLIDYIKEEVNYGK